MTLLPDSLSINQVELMNDNGEHSLVPARYFPAAVLISLASRPDRRRETYESLFRVDWPIPTISLRAIAPDTRAEFLSPAVRGCYLSHLEALRLARANGWPRVIVFEDDVEVEPRFVRNIASYIKSLSEQHWDILYIGHATRDVQTDPISRFAPPTKVDCLHCYVVQETVYERVISYLELCLLRPAGHPEGGPMFPDGAYNMFRAQNPDVVTLGIMPPAAYQRSSRSNLTPSRIDRIPGLRNLAPALRSLKRAWWRHPA